MNLIFNRDKSTPFFVCFITAMFFACFLMQLQIDAYVDRGNYLIYASSSQIKLNGYLSKGIFATIFNEPLWLFINITLSTILSPEWVLKFIIFSSTFFTTFIVLRNITLKDYLIVLFFLMLPLVLKNNIIHIRQGVAIAFFLCGWFSQQKKIKHSLLLCAALVHSSFMIVLFCIFIVNIILHLKLSYGFRNVLYIIISLLVGTSALLIANFLGARQGAGYEESANVSGVSFIFWGGVTSLFILQGRDFLFRHAYAVFFLFLYLSTYFLVPVTARIFESVLLVVLLATIRFKRYQVYFLILYLLYFIVLWSVRLGKPGFGWGIENYFS